MNPFLDSVLLFISGIRCSLRYLFDLSLPSKSFSEEAERILSKMSDMQVILILKFFNESENVSQL